MTTTVDFITGSEAMKGIKALLSKVAALDTTVLLQGESGTGKEVAARFIHARHPKRRSGPFVSVHCGAIPENLVESEMFGHMRGAFTGADRDRIGRFEQADGGTLFLDEISTMSPEAQIRLLRVLQERVVTPLGARNSRAVDVRVIAATNCDLRAMVVEDKFRLDLYYRLATFPVDLPPLRDRIEDLPPLIECLGERVRSRLGLDRSPRFSGAALDACLAYGWPGNVRELENAVEYAAIKSLGCEGVEAHDLPPDIAGAAECGAVRSPQVVVTECGLSFRTAVTRLEKELILQSLEVAGGNKARAAELLSLKRTTFLEKMRRLDLDAGDAQLERSSAVGSVEVTA